MKDKDTLNELIRKTISVGIGAAFMTEEAVKKVLQDAPIPKEMLQGLIQQAKTTKLKLNEIVREEIKNQLSRVNPSSIVEEVLKNNEIEVKATFTLVPKNKTKKKKVSKKKR
ncbi:MAG: hypothetical protein E2O68_03135 [Deltaproteobacteria bacterium]|nr:MAG: hypothetical protein E2O68_03135 [Deltaproteobacteria bacterium]